MNPRVVCGTSYADAKSYARDQGYIAWKWCDVCSGLYGEDGE